MCLRTKVEKIGKYLATIWTKVCGLLFSATLKFVIKMRDFS